MIPLRGRIARTLAETEQGEETQFSASSARVRSARAYLYYVMPAVLAVVALLTLIGWLVDPSDAPPEIWGILALFWLTQAFWIVLVRRGADPLVVAGVSFVVFAAIESVAMFASPEPVGASSSMIFFIVAASYFLGARSTIAFAIAVSIVITWASHRIEAWGEAYWIPSTAFVAFATGVLCAFIMNRVRRTERRLEQLARDERAAREKLEQVDRARDRLIANVSHELRTPLTSTIGSVETLLRDDVQLDERSRDRLLLVARDGGLRLLALVEDLLTLGATRPDSLDLDAESQRLGVLVQDAIAGLDPGDGRSIVVDVRADPPVRVDRLRMLQVVGNLVMNAIRHGRGTVVVEVSCEDREAVLRVLDDGNGVDPEHTDELFLPFARFSTRADSTGLGLAICRTIVDAHDGAIEYGRTHGRTCFSVRLPIDDDPADGVEPAA